MLEEYDDLLVKSQESVAALQAKLSPLGTMANIFIGMCSQVIDAMKEVERSTKELDDYCKSGGDAE